MSTVLFVGGGSMGHIAPSIAVAQDLQKNHPDAKVHFVCLPSEAERKYIDKHGFDSSPIDASRLNVFFLWQFVKALAQAKKILSEVQPSIVFSKGGYVSVPMCLAAHMQKIPIVLHESDMVSGRANRLVSRWANRVCLGFPHNEKITMNNTQRIFTGNPVRSAVTEGSRENGLALTGLSGERPILLVMGGSQGARALNEAIISYLDELLNTCDIVHLTGISKADLSIERKGYWQREFVTEDLPHLYAIADLALSRAGAGGIAELSANGIPMILIPLRDVGHDHQRMNAQKAREVGGCVYLEQEDIPKEFVSTVKNLIENVELRTDMSKKVGALAASDAAGQISKIIYEYL